MTRSMKDVHGSPLPLTAASSASHIPHCRGAVELDDLFVDPDWMRQGTGQALMLDISALACKHGVQRVEVTAKQHALVFYEMVGIVFEVQNRTRFGPVPRTRP